MTSVTEIIPDAISKEFVTALSKAIQSVCNGYVRFTDSAQIVGQVHLTVDLSEPVLFVIDEKSCRVSTSESEETVICLSHTFHTRPETISDDNQLLNYSKISPQNGNVDTELETDISGTMKLEQREENESCRVVAGVSEQDTSRTIIEEADSNQKDEFETFIEVKVLEDPNKLSESITRLSQRLKESKPFQCDYCDMSFKRKGILDNHRRTHTGEKPFKCSYCGDAFARKDALTFHMRKHSSQKLYKCDICFLEFSVLSCLQDHKITHTGDMPYVCQDCGQGFTARKNLYQHRKTHLANKPFKCKECGKGFNRAEHLRNHKITHSGEKRFVCGFCGKAFSRETGLRNHEIVHSTEKPHKCGICGKAFSRMIYLTNHERTHSGERPFMCDICGRGFATSNTLRLHKGKMNSTLTQLF